MQLYHLSYQSHDRSFEPLSRRTKDILLPTLGMFMMYVLPFSAIAPLMIYYAGTHHNIVLLSTLNTTQLILIGSVFFIAELVMTFTLASLIQWLSNATLKITRARDDVSNDSTASVVHEADGVFQQQNINFRDAYTLAAIAPTPLWLASLALFIPNFAVVATVSIIALGLSMYILYAATPLILKMENMGEGALMGWVLLSVGMIGWAAMMYLTFISWAYITGRSFM